MSHARAIASIALVAASALCCAPRALRSDAHQGAENPDASWRITVDPALRRLDVRACFASAPRRLVPGVSRAARWLVAPRLAGSPSELAVDESSGAIELSDGSAGGCVDYAVDLARLVSEDGGRLDARAAGQCVVLNPDLFIWRPRSVPSDFRGLARFELPAGFDVSTAWPTAADGSLTLDASALNGSGRVVLGRFSRLTAPTVGGTLDVAVADGARAATDDGIRRWLSESARANALVYGAAPVPSAQVIVIPVPGDRERPVVFGMALRGGGPALVLLLDADAPDEALPGEWIAIHELFHLGMPAVRSADAWLSEGVTMYYSEILRARAGFASPDEAWQRVHDGFGRGRRDGTGRTLRDESAAMRQTAAYMRVYWGGAAIALAWDVAMRQRSSGQRSLDDALRHLHDCCRDSARSWSADEVVQTLDRWWGSPLFSGLADPVLDSTAFPELGPLYASLGLTTDGTRLRIVSLPGATLRDAITTQGAPP
jgi:hypothetical protein